MEKKKVFEVFLKDLNEYIQENAIVVSSGDEVYFVSGTQMTKAKVGKLNQELKVNSVNMTRKNMSRSKKS